MRPEIDGLLEKRVKNIYKQAGYGTATELVRDAVRLHVNELEAELKGSESKSGDGEAIAEEAFKYRILTAQNHPPEIRLIPEDDSDVQFERLKKGDPPHPAILDTGTAYISGNTIISEITDIQGVDICSIPQQGDEIDIRLFVDQANERALDTLVTETYETLDRIIDGANDEVQQGELTRQESYRNAVQPYWDAMNK